MKDYECFKIRGEDLEYIDSQHTYIYMGIKLPSITTILGKMNKEKYAGVSERVLNRAAELGTNLHNAIQLYEEKGFASDLIEFKNYLFLKKHYQFEAIMCEQPVVIWWNYKTNDFATNEEINKGIGVPIACGRLDQISKMNSELGIIDFKRTSSLDKNSVALQTNLYRVGYLQSYEIDIKWLAVIHLREDVRKFQRLPINQELIRNMVIKFLESEE